MCAAFAYLLSAFGSSLFWLVLDAIFNFTGNNNGGGVNSIGALLSLTIPSVFIQCIVRMSFVKLYFGVEDVIRKSVRRHEDNENNVASGNTTNNGGRGGDNDSERQRRGSFFFSFAFVVVDFEEEIHRCTNSYVERHCFVD